MITGNEGGTLYELSTLTANENGTLYKLNTVTANKNGTLYEIFSAYKTPDDVVWTYDNGSTTAAGNSLEISQDYGEVITGNFTLPTETVVTVSGTFELLGGTGTGGIYGNVITVERLESGDSFSETYTLPAGDYYIDINGGGGDQSSRYGYKISITVTFSNPKEA